MHWKLIPTMSYRRLLRFHKASDEEGEGDVRLISKEISKKVSYTLVCGAWGCH